MRRTAAWVALAAAGIAGALVVGGQPPRDGLVMTSLDVGHGDAVVLQLPGGPTALVDTGGHFFPQAEDALVRRRLVPALTRLGIDRLDLVVVTHADRDHVGAGAALARRIPVGELWLPPCELASPGVKAFAEAVARSGGTVRRIHRAAPVRWQGVDMELLWPPPDVVERDGSCRGGKNEASVVLALRYAGRRVLLAGDVEDDSEARLVREVADGLRADVLKVPHHGSRSSSTVEFLERVRPRVAVVTGQWKAGPMPPHPAVVRRYRRLGSHTWITGRDGAVTVRVDPDGSLSADGVRGPSWRSSPGEEVLRPP